MAGVNFTVTFVSRLRFWFLNFGAERQLTLFPFMDFALVWLSLTSLFLVQEAHSPAERFVATIESSLMSEESCLAIRNMELPRMGSSWHLTFSVPLASMAGLLPTLSTYQSTAFGTGWASLVLAAVLYYAGVGVWGLRVAVRIS